MPLYGAMYQRSHNLSCDIRSKVIADNDLASLFCNLIDNAIESAGIVPDSFIEINTILSLKQ